MKVLVPEPFQSALEDCRFQSVCDMEADSSAALYGRALVRLRLGRDDDARKDLERAVEELGDPCRLDLVLLDLKSRGRLSPARGLVQEIADRADEGSWLKARALHVLGLIHGKLRNVPEATRSLLAALDLFRGLDDLHGRAQVQDTLGGLHASQGRIDLALSSYSVSIVMKTAIQDRYGTAITLGNLGRAHLQAGRLHDALECFELNYRTAQEIGDSRGCCKALNDMGRVYTELEDFDGARRRLEEGLRLAREHGYEDQAFYYHKDLVGVALACGALDEAETRLEEARALIRDRDETYLELLIEGARGQLLLARGEEGGLDVLENCARSCRSFDVPDFEIRLWVTLARAYAQRKLHRNAEVCLESASERARHDGFERYLRPIREAVTELECSSGLAQEEGRLPELQDEDPAPESYAILTQLGSGAFGDVFKAYDPIQDRFVAIKHLALERIYDVKRREAVIQSALTELESASRVRHPGIARVHAVGRDRHGGYYVVQEFVRGTSLQESELSGDPIRCLRIVGLVAAALDALHAAGVVHRDVKPANVMLRAPTDTPVLIDFGLAYVSDFDRGFASTLSVGTLGYMAPEQLRGRDVTSKADIYPLGIMLYEFLTETIRAECVEDGKSIKTAPSSLDMELLRRSCQTVDDRLPALIQSLLAPDPSLRPDARTVAAFLDRSSADAEERRDEIAFWLGESSLEGLDSNLFGRDAID